VPKAILNSVVFPLGGENLQLVQLTPVRPLTLSVILFPITTVAEDFGGALVDQRADCRGYSYSFCEIASDNFFDRFAE
jgi:hypothetical protein